MDAMNPPADPYPIGTTITLAPGRVLPPLPPGRAWYRRPWSTNDVDALPNTWIVVESEPLVLSIGTVTPARRCPSCGFPLP